ncbi:MAG: hypothetical protein JWQ34_2118 [Mucilaginibacter sp.]|uniref:DUF2357 domain-containing protein n=1 Tax=Mucilaginibacter sp. TaxID=1882438 RepID=UPI00262DF5D7|nr:DUF2357 domain-containing protein [Mucilaginibacter sp.]MDB5003893.1 hypothetical protein [Mucilaginibacter sp.]
MPTKITEGRAQISDDQGNKVATVKIRPLGQFAKQYISALSEADEQEMAEWGEERFQLLENCRYEYEIIDNDNCVLQIIEGIITKSAFNPLSGTIESGSNIGLLVINAEDDESKIIGQLALEVRSSKLEYRHHYRTMLEDITDQCAELLMQIRSPARGLFHPNPRESSAILAQRFSFLKHLLTTRDFRYAIIQLLADPHIQLFTESNRRETAQGFRPSSLVLRQIRSASVRTKIPAGHPLNSKLPSLPSHLYIQTHVETSDTSENQFVKYALEGFSLVFLEMQKILEAKSSLSPSDKRLLADIINLKISIDEIIIHQFFRRISAPKVLNLGSPVLQNKSGYREVLIAWLRFNAAARLVWNGGEDIYGGGKKDVAVLYEYWVFFKLLDLVQSQFNIPTAMISELIEFTADGFGLKLKAGRSLLIRGDTVVNGRRLGVRFSYNRVYNRSSLSGDQEDNYPLPGSWTQVMRPDYTLSLWPFEFTELESEKAELISHIHFDAKYKINTPADLIADDFETDEPEDISKEDLIVKDRKAKRTDFLTLHSYRDAIRRTEGAYIIYPGDQSKKWRSFHELLPGIGAFALRPESADQGLSEIGIFLHNVAVHIGNRATIREKIKLMTATSYKKTAGLINTTLPELIFNAINTHPDDCFIIRLTTETEAQYHWMLHHNKLIIPLVEGGIIDFRLFHLSMAIISDSNSAVQLFGLNAGKNKIVTGAKLESIGFPHAEQYVQYISFELVLSEKYFPILTKETTYPQPGTFEISDLTNLI